MFVRACPDENRRAYFRDQGEFLCVAALSVQE